MQKEPYIWHCKDESGMIQTTMTMCTAIADFNRLHFVHF